MYRLNEKNFSLNPSSVGILCIAYYLFMDHITKDNPEFDKAKKFILVSFFLYSLVEFIILILN